MLNQELKNKIQELCKNHKVLSLFVFGSILTDKFNEKSDVDLIVDFDCKDPFSYTDYYFSLKEKLEKLFNRKVDLLEERALKNPYLIDSIEKSKKLIYGG